MQRHFAIFIYVSSKTARIHLLIIIFSMKANLQTNVVKPNSVQSKNSLILHSHLHHHAISCITQIALVDSSTNINDNKITLSIRNHVNLIKKLVKRNKTFLLESNENNAKIVMLPVCYTFALKIIFLTMSCITTLFAYVLSTLCL